MTKQNQADGKTTIPLTFDHPKNGTNKNDQILSIVWLVINNYTHKNIY